MKRVLYIGQYTEGTTSRMRAEVLEKQLRPCDFEVIDTHVPFYGTSRIMRSLGFRFKAGPLIRNINDYIQSTIKYSTYELIWIDKGVFIRHQTITLLREKTGRLVHFTPDMAFFANQSKLFNQSIAYYDFVITTKSCEIDLYKKRLAENEFIFTTQGFDKNTHKPFCSFEEKDNAVVFIGLAEPHRLELAEFLVDNDIVLKLAGKGWKSFVAKYKENPNLRFLGDAVFKEDYSKLISSSILGLGLLSKRFPEMYTTRTFEIPACGTALLTERNTEIESFFTENEVIFYDTTADLVEKIKYYQSNLDELKGISEKGHWKVTNGGFDYDSIIENLLEKVFE